MKCRLFLLQIILILVALVSCNNSVDDVFDVVDASSTPLTLEFIEKGEMTLTSELGVLEMKYSKDGGKTFTKAEFKGRLGIYTCTIEVSVGDKISLYSLKGSSPLLKIGCTADCYVYGNIMSLVYSEDFKGKDTVPALAFIELFYENNHVRNHATKPLVLPATNLGDSCYSLMFAYSMSFRQQLFLSVVMKPCLNVQTFRQHHNFRQLNLQSFAILKCSADVNTLQAFPSSCLQKHL